MDMKETLFKQSKETRCYIMAAVMFFEGFNQINEMTEIRGKMLLDVLGLSKEDMERLSIPNYSQIVSHLKPISDSEVKHWVITNTYSPVLKSKRADAVRAFRTFCADLRWDVNDIKKTMKLAEELLELKPVPVYDGEKSSSSGCLSVVALIIASTVLCAFAFI
jgi:hypothetical protein